MPDRSPFVGPRPFESGDDGLFFAREAEIDELFDRLSADRCTLLYSKSGLGKSSLVEAGLRPRLEKERWLALRSARVAGTMPLISVENLYVWNVIESSSRSDSRAQSCAQATLAEYLSGYHTQPDTGIVLILDQFEELFTQPGTARAREGFFNQLSDALTALRHLSVLIVMREEFIADLDANASVLPGRLRSRMRLERLNRKAAATAIESPLSSFGIGIDEPAMEALLDFLTREKLFTATGALEESRGEWAEPVQLQIVAQQLWEGLPPGTKQVTLQHVKRLESGDPLASFYQDCLEEAAVATGISAGRILRWCSQTLVTPAGTRALVYRDTDSSAEMPNSVIDVLQKRHLVRGELRAGARWIELAHDQFVRPVQEAQTKWERSVAVPLGRARGWMERAKDWANSGQTSDKVLTAQEVEEAKVWLNSDASEEIDGRALLGEFVTFSEGKNARARGRNRRLRQQRLFLAACLVLALGGFWWAWGQKERADMQNQLADKLFQQKERALLKEKDAEAAKQEAVREFEALKAKREIEEGRHQTERTQAIMAATSSANNKLENQIVAYRRQGEQLDQQTRQTTALQLADKVPGLGSAFSDSTQQQRLNFSYLAAKVTYDRDKSIIPEADAAMHRALPPARLRTNALIAQGTISAGGSAYAISTNGIVSIYRLPDGKFWRSIDLQPWFGPTFSTPVTLNADSTRLWVSRDDRVVVLDIIDVSPKPVFDQQFDARRFLMFNPAATLLLAWTGPTGGQPAVWNIDSGTKVGTTLPYEGRIVFDGDGKRLFAVHLKSISVSESPFDSWKPIWKPLESAVKTFTVLKDGRVIILLEDRRLFRVSSDGSSAAELTKLEFPSDAVAVVLDAHWLEPRVRAMIVSVSARGEIKYKVKIFNLADEKHVEALDFPEFTGVPELFRDGRLAIPGQDGEITVWTAGAEQPKRLQVTTPPNFGVSLAKGNRVGGVSRDGLVTLLQPGVDKDQQGIWKDMGVKLPGRANTIRANTILLNPNGDRALIGYSDGSIWLGDPISGQTQYERRFGSELIEITIDESWANVAAAGDDGRIGVWELTHGESPRFVKAHAGRVRAIALSRDGALLASAAEDGIKIWKTANFGSESPRKSLQASGPTNALVFAGSEVIAGAEDGSITEWNVTTGYKRELVRAQKPTLEVFALAVDPDGKRLASGGADRILRVYDLKTGSELTKIAVYDGAIRRIAFDPSGLNVAAITDSGMIRVDPISSVDLMDTIGKLITKPFTRDECIKNAPLVASVCPVPAK